MIIRSAIQRQESSIEISNYSLHKIVIAQKDLYSLAATSLGEPLSDSDSVSEHWPEGFPPDACEVALKKLSETPIVSKTFQGRSQQEIINGRPENAVKLPIGLFHPVFDSFQQRIDSTSYEVSPWQLSHTVRLFSASQDIYDEEDGANSRIEAFKPILGSLLGFYIQSGEIPGTKSGGILQAGNGAHYMIMEVNNEMGTGGSDPTARGATAYAKYWGQPLTPLFSVANNPCSPSNFDAIAKIFASLADSLSELAKFYGQFQESSGDPDPTRFCPHIQHFTHQGQRVDIEYKAPVPGKAVFRALARPKQGDPYPIIVKFAESYNIAAHRLLETKKLAPELFFVSSEGADKFKVAQRIMVVMREVPGRDLSGALSISDCVRSDVRHALDILHKDNLVFGDLQHPNILAVENQHGEVVGGMLVDFDWCGTVGQATYPCDINLLFHWLEGVGPGLPMSQAHDWSMYETLNL
ncbi:hypothetical protein FRC11_010533 [Ceratobasidium sp. 423]|nr:hypothetical protein FRC11_010533 [Ceratobasidium sp. 423]